MKHTNESHPTHPRMLLLAAIAVAAIIGCSRHSPAPLATPAPPVSTTAPAVAATLPATLPAGSYRVTAETTFGRSDNGRLVYESIEAGTLVVLLRADPEWSRVRRPDGQEGLVPTARLEPKISFEPPDENAAKIAEAPIDNFVFGPVAPPAVPNFDARQVAKLSKANGGDESPEKVRAAIERAFKYLQSQRQNDNWEAVAAPIPGDPGLTGERWGQLSALSTYALLRSGEASNMASNMPGCINWLRNASITAPSAVALRAQISAIMPVKKSDPQDKSNPINADARLLAQVMVKPGLTAGPVPKGQQAGEALYYLDANQSVVAGMAALEQAGAEFPLEYWRTIEQASVRAQQADGSWIGLEAPAADRARVTGAGVANRVAIYERLYPDWGGMGCLGTVTDRCLLSAADWLDAYAGDAAGNPAAMWAVEEAALVTGRKYFGTIDWYRTGAQSLLKTQNADGSWPATPGADPAGRCIPETAYALLFLVEGSGPLIVNKLDYESKPDPQTRWARHFGPAQERPRDVAHLAAWVGNSLDTSTPPLWRWVNFSMPAADFQEAPVLYVAGSEPLDFTPAQVDVLRNYVERGGLILGNADCGSPSFIRSFVKLGDQLWPKYQFRPIMSDHPLLSNEAFRASRWRRPATVVGLSNGVRELMLLIPDSSRAWQLGSSIARRDSFELGSNVLQYAGGLNDWPDRGGSPLLLPNDKIVPKRTIRVARLDYVGNSDPEPGGWERLAALMHNQFAMKLDVVFVKPAAQSLTRANPPFQVASLAGTLAFNLSDEARAEIAAFVNAGGTLIVDAAGGNEKFAASAQAELSRMFPPPPGQAMGAVLLPKDPVYTLKSAPIDHFGYRRFARAKVAGHLNVPRLQGITVGNRVAVFFSPEDLSNGLVGNETDGIIGYDPETATAIMRNVLLYAAGER